MKTKIACSYCRVLNVLDFGKFDVEVSKRKLVFPAFKCVACGSSTIVEISTKRKAKGAGQRAAEAARLAADLVAVDARRAENAEAGAKLAAEDGCTCREPTGIYSAGTCLGERDTGHWLSTGWSSDGRGGPMLPTPPRHQHRCPCSERGE